MMHRSIYSLIVLIFFLTNDLYSQQNYWSQLNLSANEFIYAISFTPQGEIYVGTSKGVHCSIDSGKTWIRKNAGLPDKPSVSMLSSDATGNMYAKLYSYATIGLPTPMGVYLLKHSDTIWGEFNKGLPNKKVTSLAVHPLKNTLYAGTATSGVFRFQQTDTTWIQMDTSLHSHVSYLLIDTLNDNIFAGTWNGVFRSTNDGVTFEHIGPSSIFIVNVMTVNTKGYIFAGSSNFGIVRSTNNGTIWTNVNTLPNDSGAIAFVVNKVDHIYTITNQGFFYSKDDGDHWMSLPWINMGSFLAFDFDGFLYAGTQTGQLYRSKVSTTTNVNSNPQLVPDKMSLQQNFPNPFNPSTVISYSILQASLVTLNVYNALGQEIESLINEKKEIGTYGIEWNASRFPSGLYFYRLQTDNFSETKKMVFLK